MDTKTEEANDSGIMTRSKSQRMMRKPLTKAAIMRSQVKEDRGPEESLGFVYSNDHEEEAENQEASRNGDAQDEENSVEVNVDPDVTQNVREHKSKEDPLKVKDKPSNVKKQSSKKIPSDNTGKIPKKRKAFSSSTERKMPKQNSLSVFGDKVPNVAKKTLDEKPRSKTIINKDDIKTKICIKTTNQDIGLPVSKAVSKTTVVNTNKNITDAKIVKRKVAETKEKSKKQKIVASKTVAVSKMAKKPKMKSSAVVDKKKSSKRK